MKAFLTFICCIALVAAASAENPQEKKKKGAGAGAGAQVQPQGGKHPNLGRQGMGNSGRLNALRGGNNTARANRNLRVHANATGKLQARHFELAKGPNPKIASVKFNEHYRIAGAEHWRGAQYEVFRTYHPVWHDRIWWTSHYPRIVLIGGGWYYWNAGFWFPAWGYDPVHVYYPYDGPIYGYNGLPPDQVVANVQETLQSQGYYDGEVDGLLGPLTRAALAKYQSEHDLEPTAAIDQPTMQSLGFA